ncbi:MAG TPA: PQQ-binding-like beta-propeller repeat protein [Gemmataceae bacterium]|nr:PQQ-binding-like beta-propeller repeat protein [Gemmataceae bacterium]
MTDTAGQPLELPPGAWEAPPVRRPSSDTFSAAPSEPAGEEHDGEVLPVSSARRRARRIMAALALAVVVFLGFAGWIAWSVFVANENRLRDQAQRAYQEGRFVDAANQYRSLASKFPESTRAPEYQLLAELSELRDSLQGVGADPRPALDRVRQFLTKHTKEALLKPYGPDLGQSVVQFLKSYAAWVEPMGEPIALAVLDHADGLLQEFDRLLPGAIAEADRAQLAQAFQRVRDQVARRQRHEEFLARLHDLLTKPSAEAVKEAHRLIKRELPVQPGIDQDPKVRHLLVELYKAHRNGVTYTPAIPDAGRPPRPPTPAEPSLLVDQLVSARYAAAPEEDRTLLALARGVLYFLSRNTGAVKGALRVGIDTSTLPIRLPATLANPEMFLVLSTDAATLTALDTSGQRILWEYHLGSPCLGRPLVVDQRVFVPTYDGKVHEIELARGQPLGHYDLGQPLSVGGARQPGTYLLYFPADDYCVYVLNVDPRQRCCEKILYSRHPSGSLRSEPILTSWGEQPMGGGPQGYLILSQTHGLDAMELRVFSLPLQDPDAQPLAMQPQPRVRGWTWFPPHHDPEKLALITDAGVLSLFGIRQLRNQDNPLFPLVPEVSSPIKEPEIGVNRRGRAQVVHAQENDFWVLAQGRLQRMQLTFDRRTGPRVIPVWDEPLVLGSPLHVSQVDDSPFGPGLGLLVVTQSLGRQACLATMVNAEDGQVRWQRQLGLVCQGEPLVLGREVIAVDQGGGLFRFDPAQHPPEAGFPWQVGGQSVAGPLADLPGARPYLLPGPDGASAYEIAPAGEGTGLVVRHYQPGKDGQKSSVAEHVVDLRAPLAGEPALSAEGVLLPLADGSIWRLNLPPDGSPAQAGPDWRGTRSPVGLQPYVVWLTEQDLLTTDGGRGLWRWRWPRGGVWHQLPKEKDPRNPTLELPARIVAPPVVLRSGDKADPQVCIADADGHVWLVRLKGDGLDPVRHWELDGRITAGPFLRGGHVGCVVDRRRLVWLDPTEDRPLWEYTSEGEGIVGQPQLIEGLVLVADQSGKFVGLDPATGQPRGSYTLRANAAPAAAPVAFGPGRAFAPLTDGTVLLLSLDRLRDPLLGFPALW